MPEILPTEQAYDVWAATYDDGANPLVALVERVLATEPVPARVVELGCGTGRNLAQLRDRGATALSGVDLSEGMLDVARKRVPEARLVRQDAGAPVPLDDGCADLVLISLVLEHVADPRPMFAEAARLLAPGGALLVLELHPRAATAGSRARVRTADGAEHHTAWHVHPADELDGVARSCGLTTEALDDLHPDAELAARFPSSKRAPGIPWLLRGRWRRA
jgi:SAM-dependent methyltransferase